MNSFISSSAGLETSFSLSIAARRPKCPEQRFCSPQTQVKRSFAVALGREAKREGHFDLLGHLCEARREGQHVRFAIMCLLIALALAFVWSCALPRTAYAYVDPSVMTYTIQALAGVAVALSAVAGVVIRRVRRKFIATFNIDESQGKAREGDVHAIDPASPEAGTLFARADQQAIKLREESAKTSETRNLERLTWKKRFAFALLICFFAAFIIFIAPAIEIFGGNDESLVFNMRAVWWISAVINTLLAVIAAALISALKPKLFTRVLLIVFCITIAAYVQTFFLNQGMMPADGGFIGWHEWYFVQKMIVSGLVWAAIIAVPLIASKNHRIAWLRGTAVVAACVIVMQAFGVGSVFMDSTSDNDHRGKPYVTSGELYTVSPEKNVIVFVPDTYDTALIEQALQKNPHLLDDFTGFTYFRNALGTMIPTQYALPYLLSGEKPLPDETLDEYRANRYERGELLPSLDEAGYSLGVYTDSAMFDYGREADRTTSQLTENIHPVGQLPIDILQTYFVLNQCALYREAPWILKPIFWYYTTDINNRMIASVEDASGNDELYELDDARFLETLKSKGLSFTDDSKTGAFRLIHLFGPHFPFNMDENGNHVMLNMSDQERQALGTLKVMEAYLDDLKKLGVYDDATIIITADHGIWREQDDPVQHPISPLLMVKPCQSAQEAAEPCIISDAPVSHEDVAPTIIEAIGGDASSFGSGTTVWDADDARTRTFDALTNAGGEGRRIVEYEVTGDVSDLSNWNKTGNEWSGA